jgi:glycerol-3-phosphate acyltransferase PlsY
MIIESFLFIIGGYLLGSVSAAYLAGRWIGGKDLRQYGSGNLGGSMVWEHVGPVAAVVAGLYDLIKAALPAWLALQIGLSMPVAAAAGLAAVAGHCWSVFLGFTGGRGLLSYFGLLLLLIFPWGAVWLAGLTILGHIAVKDSAPFALTALVTMPLLSYFVGGPEIMLPLSAAMLVLALAKRLEANRRPLPPPGPERRKVLLRRMIFDRDIADHQAWIDQQPETDVEA